MIKYDIEGKGEPNQWTCYRPGEALFQIQQMPRENITLFTAIEEQWKGKQNSLLGEIQCIDGQ